MNGRFSIKCRLLIYIFAVISFMSCKGKDAVFMDNLVGTWDVYASRMNAKPNGFMKDGYFTFHNDHTVESNLFEENTPLPYEVKEGKLSIKGSTPFDLTISNLANDSLYLEGRMSYYYMEYFLTKRK